MKKLTNEISAAVTGGWYPFGWYEETCSRHGRYYRTFVTGYSSYQKALIAGSAAWKKHKNLYNNTYGGFYGRCGWFSIKLP